MGRSFKSTTIDPCLFNTFLFLLFHKHLSCLEMLPIVIVAQISKWILAQISKSIVTNLKVFFVAEWHKLPGELWHKSLRDLWQKSLRKLWKFFMVVEWHRSLREFWLKSLREFWQKSLRELWYKSQMFYGGRVAKSLFATCQEGVHAVNLCSALTKLCACKSSAQWMECT